MTRRATAAAAFAGLLLSVYMANWLIVHYGVIRAWPTDLLAPAGVYMAGVAFLFRDTVQRLAGVSWALLGVAVGAALSYTVSPNLAGASAAAFALSELTGLVVLWLLGRWLLSAIAVSQVASAAVDTVVFLGLAFGWAGVHAFWQGQVFAKVSVLALAYPVVLASRRYVRAEP